MPKVSVIMSTYNDSRNIKESVESILGQSFSDYEFIIIDDASSDNTVEILRTYANSDSRIRIITNETNQGLTKNLNKALKLVSGEYIARMDGDDISHKDRFQKQVDYLDSHKDVDLIGTDIHSFGATDLYWRLPDDSEELRIRMLIRPVFAHPTFMFRKKLLAEGFIYDESFRTAQDYDFASRVSDTHKIGRINSILLEYRVHSGQVSNRSGKGQRDNADRVRSRLLKRLGVTFDESHEKIMNDWVSERRPERISDFLMAYELIDSIIRANHGVHDYSESKLELVLTKMLYTWCIRCKDFLIILLFPYICRFKVSNMKIFIGELIRTIYEKRQNRKEKRIVLNG